MTWVVRLCVARGKTYFLAAQILVPSPAIECVEMLRGSCSWLELVDFDVSTACYVSANTIKLLLGTK